MKRTRTTSYNSGWVGFVQAALLVALMLSVAYCDARKSNQPRPLVGRHSHTF